MKMANDQSASSATYRATAFADFKPELAAPGATPERLEHLKEHGYKTGERLGKKLTKNVPL